MNKRTHASGNAPGETARRFLSRKDRRTGIQRFILERLLAVVAAFFVGGFMLIVLFVQPYLVRENRNRNAWIAQYAAQSVQLQMTRSADMLMGLSAAAEDSRALAEADHAHVTRSLDLAVKASEMMVSIALLKPDGIVAYTDSAQTERIGMDMSRMPWFRAGLAPGTVVWSPVYLSAATGRPAVSCLYVMNEWLLQGELELGQLNAVVKNMSMPEGMHIDVFDDANRFLIGHSMQDINQRLAMSHLPEGGFTQERGSYELIHEGKRLLAEYEHLDSPNWTIAVMSERAQVLSLSNTILVWMGGLFLLLVSSILFMTWRTNRIWMTSYVTVRHGLHHLVEHIDRGETPDEEIKALTVRFDDFDDLLRDFYHLAESLRLAEEESRQKAEDAEKSAQAKTRFINTMSREFKNPLGGVLGATDLLLYREVDPEKRERLRMLRGSAEVLQRMMNDVLAVADLDSGTYRIDDKPFRVQTLLEETVRSFAEEAARKGLALSMRWDRLIPSVLRGDAIRIRQILFQLTDNAIRYTKEGVVRLSARFVDMMAGHVVVQFQVTDTGIGLTEEQRARVFEDFYTEQREPHIASTAGTGLGLPLVRRLLQALDGTLEVDSTPGNGSTFRFTLTLQAEDTADE